MNALDCPVCFDPFDRDSLNSLEANFLEKILGCDYSIVLDGLAFEVADLLSLCEGKCVQATVIGAALSILARGLVGCRAMLVAEIHLLIEARTEGCFPLDVPRGSSLLVPVLRAGHYVLVFLDGTTRQASMLNSLFDYTAASHGGIVDDVLDLVQDGSAWEVVVRTDVPQQSNDVDCGAFVVAWAMCLVTGRDPVLVDDRAVQEIRKWTFAELSKHILSW